MANPSAHVLREVADEQSGHGLVKLVSLLEHERFVYGHGYFWKSARHKIVAQNARYCVICGYVSIPRR